MRQPNFKLRWMWGGFGGLALLALGSPLAAQDAAEPPATKQQTAAQEEAAQPPAGKTAAKSATPYEQAYRLTANAKTLEDYSNIIQVCKEGLVNESSERLIRYYRQLMSWACNRRGEIKADENQIDQALADFEEAIQLDPERWQAIHNRAYCHAVKGDFERALADYDRTIELKPDYANARFNRGEIRYEQGDYQRAIDDYNQAIRLAPRDSAAYNSRGHAYYKLGDYLQAIRDYTSAIRIEPTNAAAYTNRGDAYADKADFARASSDYRAAIRIDPKFGRAYQSAAWLLATCPMDRYRDSRLALEAAQKAIELDGENDYRYLDTLAAAYANAGDFARAREIQSKVVALVPSDQAARYEKRLALYQQDQPYRDVLVSPPPTARNSPRQTPTSRNPSPNRRQPRSF